MFSKIGEKIKALAEVLCWLLIIASLIAGLITISTVNFIIGIAVIIIGAICSHNRAKTRKTIKKNFFFRQNLHE